MPEGLEVHHLGTMVRAAGIPARTHGKHLFVYDQDWSFGLTGRVHYDGTTLVKVNAGRIYGTVKTSETATAGVDFATATLTNFSNVVRDVFMDSRKQLGSLLLDQTHIAGIGVAWGSEILHAAGRLHPGKPAKDQDLRGLAAAIVSIRDTALHSYRSTHDLDINGWFECLYRVRTMVVYGKGTPVVAGGRTWWV